MNDAEGLHDDLALGPEAGLLVDSLSPAETRRLSALLDEARRQESAAVDAAVEAMLSAIPSAMRGRVRKVLQRDGT